MYAFTWKYLGLDDCTVDAERLYQRTINLTAIALVLIFGFAIGVLHLAPWGWLALSYWCCSYLVGIKIYPWFPPHIDSCEQGSSRETTAVNVPETGLIDEVVLERS